jgi:hypothetical protein
VFGTVAVAIVQGSLGGLMFWWLGLPAPIFWGTVMAVLAILPLFGAALVWVPAAAYLAFQGDWDKALMLAAWGTLVVGLIDNLLYPLLVRGRLRMHTVGRRRDRDGGQRRRAGAGPAPRARGTEEAAGVKRPSTRPGRPPRSGSSRA